MKPSINLLLDLDLEIHSVEKILQSKKERLKKLLKELTPEEYYEYNEKLLKQNKQTTTDLHH